MPTSEAPDPRAIARDLWLRGYAIRYIAEQLGVTERRVRAWLGEREGRRSRG